ncbi:hypothetical protein SLUN_12960 [Streptomyces lunaelactis]|uniref:SpdD protein n=1 Tax=Streptomyces lunaelactis TaxID=1535768 RepID=A0A2R4T1P5_9ACTN|nr:hypothetical protein [Streptomyces lunaelactis]AVZ72967.1 hypothetical protein SLUN_12960 [Streptomyces lunaelactis]NUK87135.1 hypothetical protein [Streptomyces lunaelactis]
MSDIEKAARDAVEAAANSENLRLVAALLQAQQVTQQAQPPACQHAPVQQSSGGAAKWVGIGVGGSIFLLTVAVSAVAVAISAVSLTICVLVLRSMWRDYQKGR